MTDKIVVMTTCDSEDLAEQISQHIVENRLAACVEILPGARSIYRWDGKVEDAHEWVLMIKTRRDRFDALRAAILKKHSYDVPEVIALPVVDGSEAYLSWIDNEVG